MKESTVNPAVTQAQSELQRAAQAPELVRALAAERKALEIRRLAYVPSEKATNQG